MTETIHQSPGGVVTVTVEDGEVTEVKVASGYLYREAELETAIAHVMNDVLTQRFAHIQQLSRANLDEVNDLVRASDQKVHEWLHEFRQLAAEFPRMPRPQ